MANATTGRTRLALIILFSCALARVRANAQFSTPYDPDFAPEPAERPRPAPRPSAPAAAAPGAERPPELPEWIRRAGPFLLLDRPDPEHIFAAPASTETEKDFEEFQRDLEPIAVDASRWNRMREDLERGSAPRQDIDLPPPAPAPVQFVEAAPGGPKPAPPELEVPSYGTSLSITGRKVIGVSISEKRFLHDQLTSGRPKSASLIDITQQLQMRMQGKVGPKITVNIDYDDTKANKQDISVVYQGDPNEVVQNASFGDIDLSLPATEFVSYNKQLFGIRVNVKYKGFSAIFIGSRTKGTTKTKQFKGNSQFTMIDVPDTAYVRHTYYDLTYGDPRRLPIQVGSERVYLSQQVTGVQNVNSQTLTVDDLAVKSSTYTGTFVRLSAGVDYTVDYLKGVLTFKNSLDPQSTVGIDFVDATGTQLSVETSTTVGSSGGTGRPKLIKTFADVALVSSATEAGWQRELFTFYNIGHPQIVPDDGRGSFLLKVQNLSHVEVGPSLNPIQKYPDTINVDFANGIFHLLQPFGISASSPQPNPNLYNNNPISSNLFHVECNFRLKTFFLEPNLVLQSEVVLLDNVKLQRNVDYFIDYQSGFITFFNEQRVGVNSTISVSYEVAPFAGNATDSLLGTRVAYEFNKHWSVGTTLLYESGSKPASVPSITDLTKSLLIYDGDTQLKNIRFASWLQGTFSAEIAQSMTNPNLFGRALIDNMEGVKQEDSAPMLNTSWQIASNPTQGPADPLALTVVSEDIPTLQINPQAPANPSDSTKALDISYDFTVNSTTEVSIVHVFSPTGLDFTQKSILQFTIFQASPTLNQLDIHLGGINEDADGRGGTTLTCADGSVRIGVPKTEDVDCDNILQPGEDIGWTYAPSGKNSIQIGANNGRIDTEDLNGNGRLDPADFSGDDYGYVGNNPSLYDATSNSTRTVMDFSGWHTFQVPIVITTATFSSWLSIKQIRISIRRGVGGAPTGTLKFSHLGVVGNTWQAGLVGDPSTNSIGVGNGSLTVTAINNIDNPGYIPIYQAGGDAQQVYNDLYGSVSAVQHQTNSSNLSEQALHLIYSGLTPGTTVFTKRTFPRAIDVSQHRNFSFLLYGNAQTGTQANGDKIFFIRAGDDVNFFEMRIPITFTGWHKFVATQLDPGDGVARSWTLGQGTPGTVILSTGAPNLQQVGELTAGIYSTGTLTTDGQVYLDEIYLDNPLGRKGLAQKLQADFTIPRWATFGFKERYVDHNFQTPTTVVSNQDNRQENAYLNLQRLSFLPLRFSLSRSVVNTPNINAIGNNSNFVNLLQAGKVTTTQGTAGGNLVYGNWPRLSLGYDHTRTDYELLTREDDRQAYTTSMSYGIPWKNPLLPRTLDANYGYTRYLVNYNSAQALSIPGNFDTDERTYINGVRMTFTPWKGSNFSPTYSLTTVREARRDFTTGLEQDSSYPKARTQTVGFASNYRLARWFNPSVSYNVTTIENEILTPSTFVVQTSTYLFNVGDLKTINRSANGNVNLTLTGTDLFPKNRLLRSMSITNGYQLQDGEVLNNAERGLNTMGALWIRTPLRSHSIVAQESNLTLRDTYNSTLRWSPLEGYALLGRLAALKTLSLTNNFVESVQRTNTTGTVVKTVATTLPDMLTSMGQLERLLYLDRWVKNMQFNFKFSRRSTLNEGTEHDIDSAIGADLRGILMKKFDTSLGFNLRNTTKEDLLVGANTQVTMHRDATLQTTFDMRRYRFTPKVDFQQDRTTLGTGVRTQDVVVVTPSVLMRADLALPRGIYLPFSKKTLLVTNRVIWTTTLAYSIRSSPVTQIDNSRTATLNTSADYEIAKNLRMTINAAMQRLWHKYLQEEEFYSYTFGSTLTFQF